MHLIELSQGYTAQVSDEDAARLAGHAWCVVQSRRGRTAHFYAVSRIEQKLVFMHRFILEAPTGTVVDHIDGNGLNNQRANIRLCSHAQNQRNIRVAYGLSGFKGVSHDPFRNDPRTGKPYRLKQPFKAAIKFDGKQYNLGRFDTAEEAARKYDAAALEFHGEFAATNASLGLL